MSRFSYLKIDEFHEVPLKALIICKDDCGHPIKLISQKHGSIRHLKEHLRQMGQLEYPDAKPKIGTQSMSNLHSMTSQGLESSNQLRDLQNNKTTIKEAFKVLAHEEIEVLFSAEKSSLWVDMWIVIERQEAENISNGEHSNSNMVLGLFTGWKSFFGSMF
jgi:hypothetical protein